MNKINLVINMRIDFLRFLNITSNQKLTVLLLSIKSFTKSKNLTFTRILKRPITFTASQISQKLLSFSQLKKKSVNLIKRLKSLEATLTSVKISKLTLSLINSKSMNQFIKPISAL